MQLKGSGWRRLGVVFLLEHCSISLVEDINAGSASGQPKELTQLQPSRSTKTGGVRALNYVT